MPAMLSKYALRTSVGWVVLLVLFVAFELAMLGAMMLLSASVASEAVGAARWREFKDIIIIIAIIIMDRGCRMPCCGFSF
jgi:hypothetical protein